MFLLEARLNIFNMVSHLLLQVCVALRNPGNHLLLDVLSDLRVVQVDVRVVVRVVSIGMGWRIFGRLAIM